MSVIVLLKNFTFVGQQADLWHTDWMQFPANRQNAQYVVIIKSRAGASALDLVLQTSWDTDGANSIGVTFMTTGGPGTTIANITSGLGPLVRLSLLASALGDSQVVLSVYLTPKKN
jgi:hypothetical protein